MGSLMSSPQQLALSSQCLLTLLVLLSAGHLHYRISCLLQQCGTTNCDPDTTVDGGGGSVGWVGMREINVSTDSGDAGEGVGRARREVRAHVREVSARGNTSSPPARGAPGNGNVNNELWIHSLSKIQMSQLLAKCLEIHQFCVDEGESERGETGPPGPPGSVGRPGGSGGRGELIR